MALSANGPLQVANITRDVEPGPNNTLTAQEVETSLTGELKNSTIYFSPSKTEGSFTVHMISIQLLFLCCWMRDLKVEISKDTKHTRHKAVWKKCLIALVGSYPAFNFATGILFFFIRIPISEVLSSQKVRKVLSSFSSAKILL